MATTITIDEQALEDADAFLTAYLSEKVPDADFSQGSVIRDFVITAIAYIFAYLEQERKKTREQQSLLALSEQDDSEEVADAVNALLSNWFITRKTGQVARLTATLHFSSAADVPLAPSTRFFRTTDLIFVPDAPASFVIPASRLVPTFDANNVVTEYTTTVNLVAKDVGVSYNLPPGKFLQADQFSPYFTYAENQATIGGGKDIESTTDLLVRAPTAISVRNLVNARSIDTVLRETFAGVTRVLSLGFGDPEMLRDFSSEAVTRLRMHVGGFTDIYSQLPITEVVETDLLLGGPFARPDNTIAMFKDAAADFLAATTVIPGDILRVVSGLPDAPREYIIDTVSTKTLTVVPRAAFSEPTDEALPPPGTYVSYTIGNLAPNYSDKRNVQALPVNAPVSGGQTSRIIQTPYRITLRGRPHYRIKQVEMYLAASPASISYLTTRVNGAPITGQYRVIGLTPENGQSAYAVDQIEVYSVDFPDPTWNMRVTYDTLVGYEDVQALVIDRFERVLASNPLAKGYNPVYIQMSIAYRLRIGATTTLDEEAMAQTVATFINTFDLTNTLDLTAITQNLRDAYPDLGVIVNPTILAYDLYAPDGQVYAYETQDIVTIFPSYPSNNAHLTNGSPATTTPAELAIRVPIANADLDPTVSGNETVFAAANKTLKDQLTVLGVSDRTLIYLTTADDITFTLVT
jgi:hypothetical protein